jgi:uncharacterized protein YuzE
MRFNYDKNEDILYIRFDEAPYAENDEVQEGVIFDYDGDRKIVGIEILDAKEKLSPNLRQALEKRDLSLAIGAK